MEKNLARELLRIGYSAGRNPVAVHGTCVEAAMELLKTGRLPSSYDIDVRKKHPSHRGYLFFVPKKDAFKNNLKIYTEIDGNPDLDDIKKLEYEASLYAELMQGRIYLRSLFGRFWPKDGYLDPENNLDESGFMVAEACLASRRNRKYLKYRRCGTLKRELKSKKGVVIGLNERALELDMEPGSDIPEDEIMIHLPRGLPAEYVAYVRALGSEEKRKLDACLKDIK